MAISKDEELRLAVLDELRWEPRISNPSAIGVAVKEGIVTLSGFVDNYMDELAAEAAATRVPGVEGVIQNIVVRLPTRSERDDLEITRLAVSALDLNSLIPRDQVKVVVKEGWVTLTGEVEREYQKQEAESTISRITGVKGITNNVQVKPNLTTISIINQIARTFQRMAAHHAREIDVQIEGNKVILNGMVRAWLEKVEAERIVRELPGVKEVINNLQVVPLLEGKEPIPQTEFSR
jgi:osmotically-inducible protein OsmY